MQRLTGRETNLWETMAPVSGRSMTALCREFSDWESDTRGSRSDFSFLLTFFFFFFCNTRVNTYSVRVVLLICNCSRADNISCWYKWKKLQLFCSLYRRYLKRSDSFIRATSPSSFLTLGPVPHCRSEDHWLSDTLGKHRTCCSPLSCPDGGLWPRVPREIRAQGLGGGHSLSDELE